MPQILKTEYVRSHRITLFEKGNLYNYVHQGYLIVRTPRFDTDPFVLSQPSRILVTYRYRGREITVDKKKNIQHAYKKYGHKEWAHFGKKQYEKFIKDLENGMIEARWSKYEEGDIYFYVYPEED